MADFTRYLAADVIVTPVDNNAKAEAGVEPPMVQLTPWKDLFGTAIDGHWAQGALEGINQNGTITESGDKLNISVPSSPGNDAKALVSPYVFNDLVVQADIENFAATPAAGAAAYAQLVVYKDSNNFAEIFRYRSTTLNRIYWRVWMGGVTVDTQIFATAATTFKFKIQRAGNNWTAWYDVGGGWVQLSTAAANNQNIGVNCAVGLQAKAVNASDCDFDTQQVLITGSGYYWDDSPEADIVDSANIGGGESYAFDAGVGETWALSGASSVEDGDGGTNKWKVGWSNTGLAVDVTWVDAVWQPIAQVTANAIAGLYNGHRYLHVKWQGNSDSTQNVNATSFTISVDAPPPPVYFKAIIKCCHQAGMPEPQNAEIIIWNDAADGSGDTWLVFKDYCKGCTCKILATQIGV